MTGTDAGDAAAAVPERLRDRLRDDLAAAGCAPLHRLGQNFMVDPGALTALVEALAPQAGEAVAEIGPGTGHLTERLLAAGCRVLAVELDRGLHAFLQRRFAAVVADGRLDLVHGDCLASKTVLHPALVAWSARPWALAANLPYDVALPVVLNALALPNPPRRLAVTVQFEAAQRLASRPGEDAWGASAAVLRAAARAGVVRRLAPSCFHPRPRVDSAILLVEPLRAMPTGFPAWCRSVFAYRRKVLPGALVDSGLTRAAAEAACAAAGLDPARRMESLDSPELVALHVAVCGPGALQIRGR